MDTVEGIHALSTQEAEQSTRSRIVELSPNRDEHLRFWPVLLTRMTDGLQRRAVGRRTGGTLQHPPFGYPLSLVSSSCTGSPSLRHVREDGFLSCTASPSPLTACGDVDGNVDANIDQERTLLHHLIAVLVLPLALLPPLHTLHVLAELAHVLLM
jgi:hypothetical protein